MKDVPNPFVLIDGLLIDTIFNPLSWWSESVFGKDALHLRLYVFFTGWALSMYYGVQLRAMFFLFMLLVLATAIWFTRGMYRRLWVSANATGKNRLRIDNFPIRIANGVLVVAVFFSKTEVQYLSSLKFIGFCFVILCGDYFMATDAMPPGYRERNSVPQT